MDLCSMCVMHAPAGSSAASSHAGCWRVHVTRLAPHLTHPLFFFDAAPALEKDILRRQAAIKAAPAEDLRRIVERLA